MNVLVMRQYTMQRSTIQVAPLRLAAVFAQKTVQKGLRTVKLVPIAHHAIDSRRDRSWDQGRDGSHNLQSQKRLHCIHRGAQGATLAEGLDKVQMIRFPIQAHGAAACEALILQALPLDLLDRDLEGLHIKVQLLLLRHAQPPLYVLQDQCVQKHQHLKNLPLICLHRYVKQPRVCQDI